MKKIFVAVVCIIVLLIACIYLFIPSQVRIHKNLALKQNSLAVSRAFSERDKWKKWWKQSEIKYHEENFTLQAQMINRYKISLDPAIKPATIQVIDLIGDSCQIIIQTDFPKTRNLIERIKYFLRGNELNDALNAQLLSVKQFAENDENIYGIKIKEAKVKDSVLLSTRKEFDHEPTVQEVYDLINALRNYIKSQDAVETNHPMLHVEFSQNKQDVMVAIPLNKSIPETSSFRIKRMVLGNILETEVRGGPNTIKKGMEELENYRADHNKVAPAISFEQLITDRSKQNDTTKWITKLYYPII